MTYMADVYANTCAQCAGVPVVVHPAQKKAYTGNVSTHTQTHKSTNTQT